MVLDAAAAVSRHRQHLPRGCCTAGSVTHQYMTSGGAAKAWALSPSSPHLVQVWERIRINGQPIGKELFTKYFWQVYGRLEKTKVGETPRSRGAG